MTAILAEFDWVASKTPPAGTPPPTRPTSTPPPGPRPQPTHPQPSGPPKVEFDWAFHKPEGVGRESGRARPTSSKTAAAALSTRAAEAAREAGSRFPAVRAAAAGPAGVPARRPGNPRLINEAIRGGFL